MIEPNPNGTAPGLISNNPRETSAPVVRVRGGTVATSDDWLAVERPLEIRARVDGQQRVVSTTMRTPGDDRALAAGFLYGERVIGSARQLRALESLDDDTVVIELDAAGTAALAAAQRPFVTTGACGVCGRLSVDELLSVPRRTAGARPLPHAIIRALPEALRAAQATFARTGGLHAAGLFSADGAPSGGVRGRRPPQRRRQAGRGAPAGRTPARRRRRAGRQRPRQLRAGAEGGRRRVRHHDRGRGAVQLGGRRRPAGRHDADRVRARRRIQHLLRRRVRRRHRREGPMADTSSRDQNNAPGAGGHGEADARARRSRDRSCRGRAAGGAPARPRRRARSNGGRVHVDLGDDSPRRALHGRQAQLAHAAEGQSEGRLRLPQLRLARSRRASARPPSSARTARRPSPAKRRRRAPTRSSSRNTRSPSCCEQSDLWLDQQGRLTHPMVRRPGGDPLRADRLGRRVRADRARAERAGVARRSVVLHVGPGQQRGGVPVRPLRAAVRHQQPARLLEHVPRVERHSA